MQLNYFNFGFSLQKKIVPLKAIYHCANVTKSRKSIYAFTMTYIACLIVSVLLILSIETSCEWAFCWHIIAILFWKIDLMLNVIQSDAAFEYSHHVNVVKTVRHSIAQLFHFSKLWMMVMMTLDGGLCAFLVRCQNRVNTKFHIYTYTHTHKPIQLTVCVYMFINIIHMRCYWHCSSSSLLLLMEFLLQPRLLSWD